MQDESARWTRRVDALAERDEADTERVKLVEQQDQMTEVSTEAVKTPAHENVELTALRVGHEPVEGWTPVLRPAHPTIDILDGRPASGLAVAAQFLKLVLWLLIDR